MEIISLPKKKKNLQKTTALDKANILSEALPYIKKFAGHIFVIKFGGSAMGNPKIVNQVARDIVLLKKIGILPIIVHGGGPQIGDMLAKLKIKSEFIDGLRVTDRETVDIVEMVLSGKINKDLVTTINKAGGTGLGLSGKDANLIMAKKLKRTKKIVDSNIEKILDLGFVGEVVAINPEIFIALDDTDIIPVIAPIGIGAKGETYNINADDVAVKIAINVGATKLIMLTDVDGVLDKDKNLISKITIKEVEKLTKNNVINGGMIPKTRTCVEALKNGVGSAHILNGNIENILLVEIFTETGLGTMIDL